MKRKFFLLGMMFALASVFLLGCQAKEDDTIVLRVANAEEYIDEGGWDEDEAILLEDGARVMGNDSMVQDFEAWYEQTYGEKVIVKYSTYGTNEELYNQMSLGNVFDLVCPSEYMIMKLMEEERLQPFSEAFFAKEEEYNYYSRGVSPYIQGRLEELEMNGKKVSSYAAGYMWGTLGIVYDQKQVSEEEAAHWDFLINPNYYKRITMKDSVRDAYFVALAILQCDRLLKPSFTSSRDYQKRLADCMNRTDEKTVQAVENILTRMRENAYAMETDSGKADLVTGKVAANMQWSGDAVFSLNQAEEDGVSLAFAVPKEGTNLWFDGWCMIKEGIREDAGKQQAAEAFVNFVSRPDNVIRNMYYIGYTSAIAGGDSDMIFQYAKYCYGIENPKQGVPYSLDYFFGEDAANDAGAYVLYASKEQCRGQLYAQYPPKEVLRRSAVMRCFDSETNGRILKMWTNIRCFRWSDWFG